MNTRVSPCCTSPPGTSLRMYIRYSFASGVDSNAPPSMVRWNLTFFSIFTTFA